MSSSSTPVLDARDAASAVTDLVALQPAFTPEVAAGPGGAEWALAQIFGKYLQSIIERLNQAPDKNKLAFLDLMGVSLLPAQAARAPLVFTPIVSTGNGRVPAQTRAGAKLPGSMSPLVFETEQDIALVAAPLVDVLGVIPDRDAYSSHSAALARGDSFHLFTPQSQVLHHFYLAHNGIFALAGATTVSISFDLATAGNRAFDIKWEFWNGTHWQVFEVTDGTAGLKRSGLLQLVNGSGDAGKSVVNGVESYWIRGSLQKPLPPDPTRVLPVVSRLRISCDIDRPLRHALIRTVKTASGAEKEYGAVGDIQPDQAYSDGAELDLSQAFYPLGKSPGRNSAFYFTSQEIFSKAGAHVTLAFRRTKSPEEQADEVAAQTKVDQATAGILKASTALAKAALDAGNRMVPVVECFVSVTSIIEVTSIEGALSNLQSATSSLSDLKGLPELRSRAHDLAEAMALPKSTASEDVKWGLVRDALVAGANNTAPVLPDLGDLWGVITAAHRNLVINAAEASAAVLSEMGNAIEADNNGVFDLTELIAALAPYNNAASAITDNATINTAHGLAGALITAISDLDTDDGARAQVLYNTMTNLVHRVDQALSALAALAATPGAGTKDPEPPQLDPPKLVWEYCSTTGWKTLLGPSDDPHINFIRSGEITFTVPSDFLESSLQNIDAFWMRARIDSGSFQILRIMTWSDPVSQAVNTMPILEQRPPMVEGFYLGYHYKSPQEAPEQIVTLNDFQYVDQPAGQSFAPYHPVSDAAPTLYLGFDGALPADSIGMYFALPETKSEPVPISVKWECFDGTAWSAIVVEDETEGLVIPGMVNVIWPGVPAPPSATLTSAKDNGATVTDPRQAARFRPGQQLYISQNGAGELVTLASIAHDKLKFTTNISQEYSNAAIQVAVMPRFGVPRSWIRVRMTNDGDPPNPLASGIYPNAVWASQMETNTNETLGGSNGEPNQAYFTRQTPVLEDEVIEVRELDGARAAVELPMLQEDMARKGMTDADLRIVTDARSGEITEAWVRWRVKPQLLFSDPDDRDLTIERTRGRIITGDCVHGRIPPAGADNIRAAAYRSGGGVIGNVAKNSITQLLSGVTAQSVTNPRVAEAGADGETVAQLLERGPLVMRHRYQAVARLDYEAMAQQASPGVAVARAYPTTDSGGRFAPGWVTLVIVPQSTDPRPQPTFDLRELLKNYILLRAPAALEGLAVIGPAYLPVGVNVEIALRVPSDAGATGQRVNDAIAAFLHPLTGGPDGEGWPFGRSVYLSDLARLVESIDGVDYASSLDLLIGSTPVGEVAVIPDNRMVCAGEIRVILGGLEV